MDDQSIICVLDRRIFRAVNTLRELVYDSKKGGPEWVKQETVCAGVQRAIDILNGETDNQEVFEMSRERADGMHLPQKERDRIAIGAPIVPTVLTGWKCPQCGAIIAPRQATCVICTPQPTYQIHVPGVPDVQCDKTSAADHPGAIL